MTRPRLGAFSRAIGTVLSLAVAAYMAAALCSAIENDLKWDVVQWRSVERSFASPGIIIRSEIPLEGGQAPEALRLGAGDSMGEGFAAPASGLYFGACDGYEHLSPEYVPELDAKAIEQLRSSRSADSDGGKLVTGKYWYFAALLPQALSLEPGSRVRADFGRGEISCLVHAVGDGFAVLRMDTYLAEHAPLRCLEAKIITEVYSGLAIPRSALRREEGETFVWVAAAGRLEKKKVNIVFTGGDFVLARLSPEAGALREGDKVLTAGEDLYEGKIIT